MLASRSRTSTDHWLASRQPHPTANPTNICYRGFSVCCYTLDNLRRQEQAAALGFLPCWTFSPCNLLLLRLLPSSQWSPLGVAEERPSLKYGSAAAHYRRALDGLEEVTAANSNPESYAQPLKWRLQWQFELAEMEAKRLRHQDAIALY